MRKFRIFALILFSLCFTACEYIMNDEVYTVTNNSSYDVDVYDTRSPDELYRVKSGETITIVIPWKIASRNGGGVYVKNKNKDIVCETGLYFLTITDKIYYTYTAANLNKDYDIKLTANDFEVILPKKETNVKYIYFTTEYTSFKAEFIIPIDNNSNNFLSADPAWYIIKS